MDIFSSGADAVTEIVGQAGEVEVLDGPGQPSLSSLNTPAISTPLKALIDERNYKVKKIVALAEAINTSQVINYFLDGYTHNKSNRPRDALGMFDAQSGIVALDAECWSRAIRLTDVLEMMPAQARNEWSKNIMEMNVPPFEEETVMNTILDLLVKRESFYAQKIDGLFRALSGDHVTNCPEGFGKRMIIARMYDEYGYQNHNQVAFVHDLRTAVAKILDREEPHHTTTSDAFRNVERDGQWNFWDGGTIRIRCYLKGTAHLEIHPEIAWQLNKVLASLYPLAIPAKFRAKPAKAFKEYKLRDDMLSAQVVNALSMTRVFYEPMSEEKRFEYQQKVRNKEHVPPLKSCVERNCKDWKREVGVILEMLGGVTHPTVSQWYVFDYNPTKVIAEVTRTGCLPDKQSHQFYPTPTELAEEVVDIAEILDGDTVLEPSAGSGGLAKLLPADRTTCVEVSKLHCTALESLGMKDVVNEDFLTWEPGKTYRKIVMNPPFSEGRAVAHVEKALTLLAPGGRLVAILPPSAKNQLKLPLLSAKWSGLRDNMFDNTSVSVVILTVDKAPF